jgi:hypothetical protein
VEWGWGGVERDIRPDIGPLIKPEIRDLTPKKQRSKNKESHLRSDIPSNIVLVPNM